MYIAYTAPKNGTDTRAAPTSRAGNQGNYFLVKARPVAIQIPVHQAIEKTSNLRSLEMSIAYE